ncbi:MAG TPA: pitrilysin family protein [Gemmatimonadaceae bacterium]
MSCLSVTRLVVGLLAIAFVHQEAAAQARRGGPATTGPDTGTIAYDVDGIRVIQRHVGSGDIVVANLYLLGGVRQITAANAGIELMLLETSERGTRSYSRDRLRRSMAQLGTTITTQVSEDWSAIGLRATRATLDSTWSILASRITEPRFDSTEVALIRRQLIAGVRQRQDSPDALIEFVADSFAFNGHPYAIPPSGTESSLARVTLQDLQRYQDTQVVKSRMLLVVVGNVQKTEVERLVRGTLARLPAGSYRWTLPDTLPRSRSGAVTINRDLPTNYILGLYPGPRADSPDYHALRIATAILSGQLFSEIRSKRNLTYAVDAPFIERAVSAGGLYVTTIAPDLTLDVMRRELLDLQTGTVDPRALERLILQFITQYFLDNESGAQQADFLARAELFYGDFRRADRFVDELRAITPADIQRAALRYMRDVRFVFIGDARQAPIRIMEKF